MQWADTGQRTGTLRCPCGLDRPVWFKAEGHTHTVEHTEVCLAQASRPPASERMRSSHTLPLDKRSSQDSAFQWGTSKDSRMQRLHSSLLPSCSSCMPSEASPSALAILLSSQCNLILLIFLHSSHQSLLHPLTQQLGASSPRVSQTLSTLSRWARAVTWPTELNVL